MDDNDEINFLNLGLSNFATFEVPDDNAPESRNYFLEYIIHDTFNRDSVKCRCQISRVES